MPIRTMSQVCRRLPLGPFYLRLSDAGGGESRPRTSVWHMESIVKAVDTAVSPVDGRIFKVQGCGLYAYRQLSLWGGCAKRRRI